MGFKWMGRSTILMDEFYSDRERYPHISDFMPRIVEFVNQTDDNFEQVKKEYTSNRPYIIETFSAAGSSVRASDVPTEVVIRFSEPIVTTGYGFTYTNRGGVVQFPIADRPVWRDEYTIVLPLQPDSLEKGKSYGMILYNYGMKSQRGYNTTGVNEIWFTVE